MIVLAVVGEFLGSFVGWSIGRFGGRPLVDKLGRYVLLTHSDLDRTERWFRKRGEPAVFFGRILPVVRTFISIPAGLAEMGLVRFGAATFAGSAIWCTAIALVGYELGGEWSKITKGFSAAGYVLVAVAVVVDRRLHPPPLSAVRREREAAAWPLASAARAWRRRFSPSGSEPSRPGPSSALTSRHDSLTATKSLAGICFIMLDEGDRPLREGASLEVPVAAVVGEYQAVVLHGRDDHGQLGAVGRAGLADLRGAEAGAQAGIVPPSGDNRRRRTRPRDEPARCRRRRCTRR